MSILNGGLREPRALSLARTVSGSRPADRRRWPCFTLATRRFGAVLLASAPLHAAADVGRSIARPSEREGDPFAPAPVAVDRGSHTKFSSNLTKGRP